MPKAARKATKRKAESDTTSASQQDQPSSSMTADEPSPSTSGNIARKFTAEEAGTSSYSISSVCDDMSLHVSQNIKEKIWKGEYVDLATLLPKKTVSHDNINQTIKVINGELVIKPKEPSMKIETIETWTDAFFIFMNIFLCKHPEVAQDMLHYMNSVRQGARRTLDYKKYDEQYRLRKARNPSSSWASVDGELWLLYSSQNIFSGQSRVSSVIKGNCFDFNNKGFCSKFNCNFSHKCIKCLGNHSALNCFTFRNMSQTPARFNPRPQWSQNYFRPRFSPNFGIRFQAPQRALGPRENPNKN